jgi:hypothetical protein
MSIWLKVTLIVLAAVLASIAISFTPAVRSGLPPLPPASSIRNTVPVVKGGPSLGATHTVRLETTTTAATWLWLLTWALALAAIGVVVYRDRRRRPPTSGTAAQPG